MGLREEVTQCKKGYWCSHEGKDYLCAGCRPAASEEELLIQRIRRQLAVIEGLAEELDEHDWRVGIEAARNQQPSGVTRASDVTSLSPSSGDCVT